MNIQPIKNEADHQRTLQEIDRLWDASENTPEYDKLNVLVTLVHAFEEEHFPIGAPDPVEAIKFRMDQLNLKRTDIGNIIGGRNRATEVLSRKRKLSLSMIRKLNHELGLPADVLIADYQLKPKSLRRQAGKSERRRVAKTASN